jgi:hypothetical protein
MAAVTYDLSGCACCGSMIECSSFPGEPIGQHFEVDISVCGSTPITLDAYWDSLGGGTYGWRVSTPFADPSFFVCGSDSGPGWYAYYPTLYCDVEGVVIPDIGGVFYETGAGGTYTTGGGSIWATHLISYTIDTVDPLQVTATYDLYGYLNAVPLSAAQVDDILSACGCPAGGPATLTVVWREV